TPGCSWAIASRPPNSRLTSVDFPTFCRPIRATTGRSAGDEVMARPCYGTSVGRCRGRRLRCAPTETLAHERQGLVEHLVHRLPRGVQPDGVGRRLEGIRPRVQFVPAG